MQNSKIKIWLFYPHMLLQENSLFIKVCGIFICLIKKLFLHFFRYKLFSPLMLNPERKNFKINFLDCCYMSVNVVHVRENNNLKRLIYKPLVSTLLKLSEHNEQEFTSKIHVSLKGLNIMLPHLNQTCVSNMKYFSEKTTFENCLITLNCYNSGRYLHIADNSMITWLDNYYMKYSKIKLYDFYVNMKLEKIVSQKNLVSESQLKLTRVSCNYKHKICTFSDDFKVYVCCNMNQNSNFPSNNIETDQLVKQSFGKLIKKACNNLNPNQIQEINNVIPSSPTRSRINHEFCTTYCTELRNYKTVMMSNSVREINNQF